MFDEAPDHRPPWTRAQVAALALILLYFLAVRAVLLDQPFSRNPEGVSSFYGLLARNYLRYPLAEHKLVPVQSIGLETTGQAVYYSHHPPLVPLLIAGSYAVFGQGEWQTRLPTAVFTLGCLLLIHHLLRRRAHPWAALLAAALFAAVPMTIMYGGFPDCVGTQLTFFLLLTIAAYLRLHDRPTAARLAITCAAFAPAMFTDWPACFVVPVLCAHWAMTKPLRSWGWIAGFGAFTIAMFVLTYGHIAIVLDDWGWMADKLARRTMADEADRGGLFDWPRWVRGIARHNLVRHTLPVLLLAAAWVGWMSWRRDTTGARRVVGLVLATGLLHVAVGRQAVLVHDWWWWLLTPGLVMPAALVLERVAAALAARTSWRVAGGIVAAAWVAFATWTTATTLPDFFDPRRANGGVGYTTVEIGEAIRAAAPEGDGYGAVVLAYNDSYDLPLWYYGDRPLKLAVWDEVTLAARVNDGVAQLPFWFEQPWTGPTVAYLIPLEFVPSVEQFIATMKQRYPHREAGKFLIFDLRPPPR